MLFLKLLLTPALIVAATTAQRRWGSAVGGLLVGLPLTAAPVNLFLAVEQGRVFAAEAASATLAGLVSLATFCVAYAWAAQRAGVGKALGFGLVAYAVVVWACGLISVSAVALFPTVIAFLCLALVILIGSCRPEVAATEHRVSKREIFGRAVTATLAVVVITTLANVLGAWWSGLLTPFPVFAGTLAVFTHYSQGAVAAATFLRGVITGSFAYAVFFLVVSITLEEKGIGIAFFVALVASLASQVPTLVARSNSPDASKRALSIPSRSG